MNNLYLDQEVPVPAHQAQPQRLHPLRLQLLQKVKLGQAGQTG